MTRDLACPNGCESGEFEAINTPLIVDRRAHYKRHDDSAATFVCAQCAAIAIDVAMAAAEMRRGDTDQSIVTLTCPACGVVMLPPEDAASLYVECVGCGVHFSIEEGMPRLFGSSFTEE